LIDFAFIIICVIWLVVKLGGQINHFKNNKGKNCFLGKPGGFYSPAQYLPGQ